MSITRASTRNQIGLKPLRALPHLAGLGDDGDDDDSFDDLTDGSGLLTGTNVMIGGAVVLGLALLLRSRPVFTRKRSTTSTGFL